MTQSRAQFPSQRDPLNTPRGMLLRAMMGESSDSIILGQEAQGQRELVAMDVLPRDMTPHERSAWESVGFRFGGDADDLFVYASLPERWRKQPSDHSMWSYIVDELGRKRAAVFYKAAFYDRKAHMSAAPRFSARVWYGSDVTREYDIDAEYHYAVVIDKGISGPTDGGIVAWQSERFDNPHRFRHDDAHMRVAYAKQNEYEKQAREWLVEHYPDADNPFAYWSQVHA